MPSNCLIRCRPLLLLPSVFPSIRVFYNELALHIRWLKYWSFSLNISPSNKYSGLIFFRIDWFELLGVQGTLKSLLQQPQLKSISSSSFSLLYGPTLTSVHVVQSFSHVLFFVTSWTAAGQVSSFFTISPSLLKLIPIELVMPSNHLICCCPFSCLQSFPASGSFPMNWLFASGGQSIGVSASVLPANIQD